MRKLYKFHGGIHPPSNKSQSNLGKIVVARMPSQLIIPFSQHAGEAAKPIVVPGDYVLKGQVIGLPDGNISSAIHAPTSGTIKSIDAQMVAHPSGMPDICATLLPDGKDQWKEKSTTNYRSCESAELRKKLRMAGVVGLGGAGFPSDVKLNTEEKKVKTLILNGAECEPYITCDDLLMRERAAEIIEGAEILCHILKADQVLIGIEDNKPEAINEIRKAAQEKADKFEIIPIPTIYPGGGVKQLIRVLTGLEIPSGKLPTDIGVQCFNVATAYSVYRAIVLGEPVISRIVTLTGNVKYPQNCEALIGTPINELLQQAEPLPDTNGYIMGGPMMGMRLPQADVPLVKASNCIIAASEKTFPSAQPTLPCIRCTRCVDVCPMELQPQDLYWFSKGREFGKAQAYSLFECIECGACSYVCPSHIPLVQYYRFAKSEIRSRTQEKQNADRARVRHEFREYRLEREKQEKAEKLAAKERAAQLAKEQADKTVEKNIEKHPDQPATDEKTDRLADKTKESEAVPDKE